MIRVPSFVKRKPHLVTAGGSGVSLASVPLVLDSPVLVLAALSAAMVGTLATAFIILARSADGD